MGNHSMLERLQNGESVPLVVRIVDMIQLVGSFGKWWDLSRLLRVVVW